VISPMYLLETRPSASLSAVTKATSESCGLEAVRKPLSSQTSGRDFPTAKG
jgi:hypothetical protein